MTRSLLRPFSLAALFAATVLAGAPEGKALFASKCQGCHAADGEGKEAIAKMFKVTMHPLASKEIQDKSDADLKKVVTDGHGKMKPVTGLTEKEAGDVVAYVRTMKK